MKGAPCGTPKGKYESWIPAAIVAGLLVGIIYVAFTMPPEKPQSAEPAEKYGVDCSHLSELACARARMAEMRREKMAREMEEAGLLEPRN